MRTTPSTHTIQQPNNQQAATPPNMAATQDDDPPEETRDIMESGELHNIVLPLVAFVASQSTTHHLSTCPTQALDDTQARGREVVLRYQLDRRFFSQETTLDEPLVALLRARGDRRARHWPLRIALELSSELNGGCYDTNAALVISVSIFEDGQPCVEHVKSLLRILLRPGFIWPLNDSERGLLGRASTTSLC